MERESFEDEEVAGILNAGFVAIKVDREERPDIDHIYMTACQMMTGQGGWPLTIVMTPECQPFFAGTYFPKESQYGRRGLLELLPKLNDIWKSQRSHASDIGREVTAQLDQATGATSGVSSDVMSLDRALFERAVQIHASEFDAKYGGFGAAPKFPAPHHLSFLLRHHAITGDESALTMVLETLRAMYRGGIWDHVGFGFSRYSTDEQWLVPHFEKMLYDNALLADVYLDAYQVTRDPFFAMVAKRIFTYVLRDMRDEQGGFYSAEDADSEGEEGKFYVFSHEEVQAVLGPETADWFCKRYGITKEGNFEGNNILNLLQAPGDEDGVEPSEVAQAREALQHLRSQRMRPARDDKILTSWNALMISALAKAARVLQDPFWLEAAKSADDFITRILVRADGRLLARYRAGEAGLLAYLEDYAYFASAKLALYDATHDVTYLESCQGMVREMERLFYDPVNGGFFYYGSDAETLLTRPKEIYDGAMPSGNSVATFVLAQLAALTGEVHYQRLRDQLVQKFLGTIARQPTASCYFLMALQWVAFPTQEIVLSTDDETREDMRRMMTVIAARFRPLTVVLVRTTSNARRLAALAPFTAEQLPVNQYTAAYVCESFVCHAPLTDAVELDRILTTQ